MSNYWQIEFALKLLPAECRYHGSNLDSTNVYRAPEEGCCDTGRYARARREGLAALDRLIAASSIARPGFGVTEQDTGDQK